jgi:two-component system cell cycle response regulator
VIANLSKEPTHEATPTSDPKFAGSRSAAATSPACLIQIYGGELGKRVRLSVGEIVIGRDERCDLGVDQSTVSRRHARVFIAEGLVMVEDLASTNGTFLNEAEVEGPSPLRNGDFIRCGGAVFKFIEGGNLEALYHEEIYQLTITDGLTQVANKRCFVEFLEREVVRATRHHRALALAMLDVDHFKAVNDRFGHLAGDRILRGIADVVRRRVRRDELLARYGGEEFAIVLPETPIENAVLLCERVREIVECEAFSYDGQPIPVTVSLGVGTLSAGESGQDLLRRVDALLYRAKSAGRNRVEAG